MKKWVCMMLALAALFPLSALGEAAQELRIRLPANPTTGYAWQVRFDGSGKLELRSQEYVADETAGAVGSGGAWQAVIGSTLAGTGEATVTLRYARAWEDEAAQEHVLRLFVADNGDLYLIAGAEGMR